MITVKLRKLKISWSNWKGIWPVKKYAYCNQKWTFLPNCSLPWCYLFQANFHKMCIIQYSLYLSLQLLYIHTHWTPAWQQCADESAGSYFYTQNTAAIRQSVPCTLLWRHRLPSAAETFCANINIWCFKLTRNTGLGVVVKFLKFVLKCPEIGVRSWNLYIYPEIFTHFHNFF